jgi:hypothetical protein
MVPVRMELSEEEHVCYSDDDATMDDLKSIVPELVKAETEEPKAPEPTGSSHGKSEELVLGHDQIHTRGTETRSQMKLGDGLYSSGPGQRIASSNVTVFETNKAPMLKSVDRPDLVRFVSDREKYLRVFVDSGAEGVQPRSLKDMVDRHLVRANWRYHSDKKELEDVVDADLEAWINDLLKRQVTSIAEMDPKLRKLEMNMEITCPMARVIDLGRQFDQMVVDNGWQRSFEDEDGQKLEVKYIHNAV